jgi:hypothetical protein
MKHLSALLLVALCATASAQTIKSLGYNTTNGEVVYSGTNPLTFTNAPRMAGAFFTNATVSSSSNYILSIGLTNNGFTGLGGGQSDIGYRRQGVILWEGTSTGLRFPSGATVSSTLNFNYGAGSLGVISFSGIDAATGAAISRTNLGLGATWLTNTNATNFRTAIGLGAWATHNDGAAVRSENLTISDGEQTDYIQFTAGTGVVFYGNRASQFRTALGMGWSALTNTNAATFQGALFSATNAAPTNTNAPTPDAWVDIQVGTNTYKLPLWQ